MTYSFQNYFSIFLSWRWNWIINFCVNLRTFVPSSPGKKLESHFRNFLLLFLLTATFKSFLQDKSYIYIYVPTIYARGNKHRLCNNVFSAEKCCAFIRVLISVGGFRGSCSHVVRSVSIIFEFPRWADYQNSDHPYVYNSWLCSLNSFVCHF